MSLHIRTILVCAAVLVLFAAPTVADAEQARDADKKPDSSDGKKDAGDSRRSALSQATSGDKTPKKDTYTNEDLQRLFGSEPSDSEQETEEPGSVGVRRETGNEAATGGDDGSGEDDDPLAWAKERQAKQEERRQEIVELEKKVAAAREQVAQLERACLALENPFLARPEPLEGESDWDSLDNVERLERTKDRLEEIRTDLSEAEDDLARAKGS